MAGRALWEVEVVFALPDRQVLVPVRIEAGSTVQEAIDLSRIAAQFPDWCLDRCRVGIWGQPVERSRTLQDGARVEIYRELRIDPRDARRQLALAGKTMGSRTGAAD